MKLGLACHINITQPTSGLYASRSITVHNICNSLPENSRNRFISLAHVRQMAQVIEEETIRLHDEDGISMKLWMDRLEQENTSKLPFKSTHSGTLAMGSLGLMQLIMSLNIQTSFFSRSLPGTGGAVVCDYYSTLSLGHLPSQFRCSGSLDACVQWN